MSTVVIYLGGDGPTSAPTIDGHVAAVIAADSGLDLADAHNIMVNLVVGDFDSVNVETLKKYVDAGTLVEEFPAEKEVTDFELALMAAKDFEAERLVVIGGGGQRLDHLLGNISVLSGEQTSRWIVDAYVGNSRLFVCRPDQPRTIEGSVGEIVSLIPVSADAVGVTTSGLKWKLTDSTLDINFARGISNEFTEKEATVSVASGVVAAVTSV